MKIRHKTIVSEELLAIVHSATLYIGDRLYGGNLKVADQKIVGQRSARFRIGVNDSHKFGARRSASGRHMPAASWEAHRDVLRRIFEIVPDAVIDTMMAKYEGREGFERTFPATASRNVGSIMFPVTMPALSVERESACTFGTLQRDGSLTNVRVLPHSALRKCPFTIFVPDHYREDGSCKCDDPAEREMMIREWEYSPSDFEGIPLREPA